MLVNLSNLQGDADNSGHLGGTQVQTLPFEHGTQTVTIIWNAMVNQMAGMANAAQAPRTFLLQPPFRQSSTCPAE